MRFQSLIRLIGLLAITWIFATCTSSQGIVSRESVDSLLVSMKDYQAMDDRIWSNQLAEVLEKGYQSTTSKALIEKSFISFLRSEASADSKNVILYHLGPIATDRSTEILLDLISQNVHFDAALNALSYIPDDQIDEHLFLKLSQLDKDKSIAIIQTLGDRANPAMVQPLAGLLDNESDLYPHILAAIGNIPAQESARSLSDYLNKQEGEKKWLVADHLIQVANALLKDDVEVSTYYEQCYDPDAPPTILFGSLRGYISTGKDPLDEMIEIFKQGNEKQVMGIMPLIRELNQLPPQSFISEGMEVLNEAGKASFLIALADRGDQRVKVLAIQAIKESDNAGQIAGLKVLCKLGGEDDVLLLSSSAVALKGEGRLLARKCLYSVPGESFDSKIMQEASVASGKVKEELILAIGERKIKHGQDFLMSLIDDQDIRIRLASMKALAMLGDSAVLSGLLNKGDQLTAAERSQMIRTVTQLTLYIPEQDLRDDAITKVLSKTEDPEWKAVLIELLGHVANEDAYQTIVDLMTDGNRKIQSTAILSLSDWPDDKPLMSLVEFFRAQDDAEMKLLALRGIERLTNISDSLASEGRAKLLISTLDACKTNEERKIVLSGLGKTGSLITFEAAIKLISSKELSSEAEAAFLQNIRNIDRDDFTAEIIQYLRSAREKSSNEYFKKELNQWLSEAS